MRELRQGGVGTTSVLFSRGFYHYYNGRGGKLKKQKWFRFKTLGWHFACKKAMKTGQVFVRIDNRTFVIKEVQLPKEVV
jgi:hypothetical protein